MAFLEGLNVVRAQHQGSGRPPLRSPGGGSFLPLRGPKEIRIHVALLALAILVECSAGFYSKPDMSGLKGKRVWNNSAVAPLYL
jgi:hypothetical protein